MPVADAAVVGSALVNVVAEHAASANECEQCKRVCAMAEEAVCRRASDRPAPEDRRARRDARAPAQRARRVRARDRPREEARGAADLPAVARSGSARARAARSIRGRSTTARCRRLFERIIDEARRLERHAEDGDAEPARRLAREVTRETIEGSHGCGDEGTRDRRAGPARDRAARGDGLRRAPLDRRAADRHRRGRRQSSVRRGAHRGHGRRAGGAPHHRALQARQPELPAGEHGDHDRRPAHRRRRGHRHGRSLFGRDGGAGRGDGGGGQARGREGPARRRLQAAQLAVQLPGTRRGGPEDAARRRRSPQPEARVRGHGHQPARAHREVRRHPAGRRAQHAELHAAARARAFEGAGAA